MLRNHLQGVPGCARMSWQVSPLLAVIADTLLACSGSPHGILATDLQQQASDLRTAAMQHPDERRRSLLQAWHCEGSRHCSAALPSCPAAMQSLTSFPGLLHRLHVIDELKNVVEQKERFLSSMSHELRTPLNGIIGLSDAMLVGSCGELKETAHKTLTTIKNSGLRLLNLINDILDAAAMHKVRHARHRAESMPVCTLGQAFKACQVNSIVWYPIVAAHDSVRLYV